MPPTGAEPDRRGKDFNLAQAERDDIVAFERECAAIWPIGLGTGPANLPLRPLARHRQPDRDQLLIRRMQTCGRQTCAATDEVAFPSTRMLPASL